MGKVTLRGGIVGCGFAATVSHLPAWRALKDVDIVAVCDQREEIAMETAKRWGISSAYGEFSQMLQSEELDFVDICSPPLTHFPLSIQAMKAGRHVLVEKPMALKVSEADEMVSTARKHDVKLCVVHNFLFTPVVQAAKSLVDTGAIGDLVSVEAEILARRESIQQNNWRHHLPGGIFGDYAPHALYLESAFLGNIHSIRAIARKQSQFPGVTADELRVLLEGENGLGAFSIFCNAPRTSFNLSIFGTKEKLYIDNFALTMIRSRSRTNKVHELVLDQLNLSLKLLAGATASSVKALLGRRWYKSGHQAIIQKFVESMRHDQDPPVGGEDGRETVRILEEIWKQISLPV